MYAINPGTVVHPRRCLYEYIVVGSSSLSVSAPSSSAQHRHACTIAFQVIVDPATRYVAASMHGGKSVDSRYTIENIVTMITSLRDGPLKYLHFR